MSAERGEGGRVEDPARQWHPVRRYSIERLARGIARQLRLSARVRRGEAELRARLRLLQTQPTGPPGAHACLHVPRLQPGTTRQQASTAERRHHVDGLQHRVDPIQTMPGQARPDLLRRSNPSMPYDIREMSRP